MHQHVNSKPYREGHLQSFVRYIDVKTKLVWSQQLYWQQQQMTCAIPTHADIDVCHTLQQHMLKPQTEVLQAN